MIGGGGAGIIVLILIAIYIGSWLVAVLGGILMLVLIVRSFLKKRRKRAMIQIGIAVLLVLPAPLITYYLTTTFENANKAIYERDVAEAAKRKEEIQKQK